MAMENQQLQGMGEKNAVWAEAHFAMEWEALWPGKPQVNSPTLVMSSTSLLVWANNCFKPKLCTRSDSNETIATHGWEALQTGRPPVDLPYTGHVSNQPTMQWNGKRSGQGELE